MLESKRKLAAILFADIVGYTALMQKDEQHASKLLRHFQRQLESTIQTYNGQIVNFYGDGALCTFQIPVDAVRCALALQTTFQAEPNIPVRIGIHSGTVTYEGDKIFGDAVNLTSRIESMGVAGGILLSKKVRDEVKNNPDLELQNLGSFAFKNVEEPMEIFALANDKLLVPSRADLKNAVKAKRRKRPKKTKAEKRRNLLIVFASLAITGLAIFFSIHNSSLGDDTITIIEAGDSKKESSLLSEDIRQKRVAVMIFENKTGSDQLESFGTMISDWITQGLIETGTPSVVNSSDIQRHAQLVNNSPSQASTINAEVTIQGRYYLQESNIIIYTSIVDNQTGESISVLEPIIGDRKEIMQLLDQLRQKLLGYWMLNDNKAFAESPPRYDAYQEYMKYYELWGVDFNKAAYHLQTAYDMDTTFNLAWIRTAFAMINIGRGSLADSIVQEIKQQKTELSKYEQMYLKKIELVLRGDRAANYKHLLAMLEKFPADILTQLDVGLYKLFFNELDEAISFYNQTIDFDNIGDCSICQWNFSRLLLTHYRLGNYSRVIELLDTTQFEVYYWSIAKRHLASLVRLNDTNALEKAIETYTRTTLSYAEAPDPKFPYFMILYEAYLSDNSVILKKYLKEYKALVVSEPEHPLYHWNLGNIAFYEEDYELAYQYYKKWNDDDLCWKAIQAVCLIKMEQLEQADEILRFIQNSDYEYDIGNKFYAEAIIRTHLGQQEEAMSMLRKAFNNGLVFHEWNVYTEDIFLKPLFDYPPFEAFVKPR